MKKFDTHLDPCPKRLPARLTKCNSKSATLPALRIELSITLIRVKVSELQIQKVLYDKEENFTLCDIMRSSHNVHPSNQNTECQSWVTLQCGASKILVTVNKKS